MKRLTALSLALAMLFSLAACASGAERGEGGSDGGTSGGVSAEPLTTTGQYREREITPPELGGLDGGVSGLWMDGDGAIDMTYYSYDGEEQRYTLFHSDDGGGSWTSTALEA